MAGTSAKFFPLPYFNRKKDLIGSLYIQGLQVHVINSFGLATSLLVSVFFHCI